MGIKKFYHWNFLLIGCLFFYGCPKECIDTGYSFSQKIYIYPGNRVIHIGDTIWIKSSFRCDSLYNLATSRIEGFCENNISLTMTIGSLIKDKSGLSTGSVDDFVFVSKKGLIYTDKNVSPKEVTQISFGENKRYYQIELGMIPQKKGKYGLGIHNGQGVLKTPKNNCDSRAGFEFTVGNTERYSDIWAAFKDPIPVTDYEYLHGYAFEVQ